MWVLVIILVIVLLYFYYESEQLNQPIIKTDPVYTVVQTSTGALTIPGKITKPLLPIYNMPNYWQLYLQRGSSTLPGQKHPMYMRGDPNKWLVWINTNRRGRHQAEYAGNMQWG